MEYVYEQRIQNSGKVGSSRKSLTSNRLGKEIGRGILDLELRELRELDTVVTDPGVVASEEF